MTCTIKFNEREDVIKRLGNILKIDYMDPEGTGMYSVRYKYMDDALQAQVAINDAIRMIRKQAQDIIKLKTDLAEIQASLQEDKEPDDAELKQLEQDDLISRLNNEIQYMRGQLNVYEKLFAPCTAYDDESCDKREMPF